MLHWGYLILIIIASYKIPLPFFKVAKYSLIKILENPKELRKAACPNYRRGCCGFLKMLVGK